MAARSDGTIFKNGDKNCEFELENYYLKPPSKNLTNPFLNSFKYLI
jgi:hypothetical protein